MKNRYIAVVVFSALGALLCFCGKGDKDRLAKVGSTQLTQDDREAFTTVTRYYPQEIEEFALASRPEVSGMIETEALYQKARWSLGNIALRRGDDWRWKEAYFTSLTYVLNVLQANLGFSEQQLRSYYEQHKDSYRDTPETDSAGNPVGPAPIRPFDEVKAQVAETMFLAEHKPDSQFIRSAGTTDTAVINMRWVEYIREQAYRDFFLNQFYREKFGTEFPDSLDEIVGKDKLISEKDLQTIISWIPVYRRDPSLNTPEGRLDLAGWLVRWKLFADKAQQTGYASRPKTRKLLQWAWKMEIAQRYISDKLVPAARAKADIDTAMALYAYWDDNGNPGVSPDTAALRLQRERLTDQVIKDNFNGAVYKIRRSKRVRFFQDDWQDDLVNDPRALIARADSLRDSGNAAGAEGLYQTLVNQFVFTEEGKRALVELAKVRTELQNYSEAVKGYRRALVIGADGDKRCNTMFMIGFIYDEYLDRPDMAEVNYKWVLKNAPGCELADDAEFMLSHLGEEMASVDELQAEVRRQGKKVEDDAEQTEADITVEQSGE